MVDCTYVAFMIHSQGGLGGEGQKFLLMGSCFSTLSVIVTRGWISYPSYVLKKKIKMKIIKIFFFKVLKLLMCIYNEIDLFF